MPDDAYLLKVGRFTYRVTFLEGMVLFDLAQLPGLPPKLAATKLAGKTTGGLAKMLQDPSTLAQVGDPVVRNWLRLAGEELEAVSKLRNSMLHARPATVDGKQRLHRWHPEAGEVFNITDEWLESALARVDDAIHSVSHDRLLERTKRGRG